MHSSLLPDALLDRVRDLSINCHRLSDFPDKLRVDHNPLIHLRQEK